MEETGNNNHNGVKILSLVWFTVYPPRFGGQKAIAVFNHYLAELLPVTCLCTKNNEAIATNHQIVNVLPTGKAAVINPINWWRIYSFAKSGGYTHLLLEFPYYGIAAIGCKKLLRMKLILHAHNIEHKRFKEQRKRWWKLLFQLEKQTIKAADVLFFKTEEDRLAAQKQFGFPAPNALVVPYGVEEKKELDKQSAAAVVRHRHQIADDESILLFAATLDYEPAADAVKNLHDKIVPLLNQKGFRYKIVVCGRNRFASFRFINAFSNDQLIIVGEVDDIDTYFTAADVFVNPVRRGGGVQTKTLDALAHHLNVVCFASRLNGIGLADNKIFPVADDDWNAFADAVVTATKTNEQTPRAFFEKYNWRSIAAEASRKIIAS